MAPKTIKGGNKGKAQEVPTESKRHWVCKICNQRIEDSTTEKETEHRDKCKANKRKEDKAAARAAREAREAAAEAAARARKQANRRRNNMY